MAKQHGYAVEQHDYGSEGALPYAWGGGLSSHDVKQKRFSLLGVTECSIRSASNTTKRSILIRCGVGANSTWHSSPHPANAHSPGYPGPSPGLLPSPPFMSPLPH